MHCYDHMNQNYCTGLVLLQFKEAFDTVCHSIFLQKLDHYGIRGIPNKLLSSFFFSHEIFQSRTENILNGVPHGSNLGPLLFLVYINDLPNILNCDAKLLADDTCLVEKAAA